MKLKLPKNKLLKVIVIIFFIMVGLVLFPITIGGGLMYVAYRLIGNKKLKYAILVILAIPTLFVGSAWVYALSHASDASTTSQQSSAATANTPTPTPAISAQMKHDYIAFYKQYMSIANKSDQTNNKVLDDLTAMSSESSDISVADLYLEASDAQTTQDSLKDDALNLQIPGSLGDYNDKLQNADDSLFSLIDSRSNAMKSLADYLNSNDLSKLKDLRNNSQQEQSTMMSAVVSLVEVGQKLGVDTTKIQQ